MHWSKIARQHSEKDTARNVTSLMVKRSRTKVAPTLLARKQMKENSAENLRKIRKQFGAGSLENNFYVFTFGRSTIYTFSVVREANELHERHGHCQPR